LCYQSSQNLLRKDELRTLLTSNFYSILYYNSEIWHIPTLNPNSKQLLLTASAKAFKLCNKDYSYDHLLITLHKINKRATSNQMLLYKYALLFFKLYNCVDTTIDWVHLNFQKIFTSRQMNFIASWDINYKIGSNLICNRSMLFNNLIPLAWLALTCGSFKLKCKDKFFWLQCYRMFSLLNKQSKKNRCMSYFSKCTLCNWI
jgi:hypothetical protein